MKRWLVVNGLRLLAATWRVRLHGVLPAPPTVMAFWHGAMLPVWYVLRRQRPVGLCSASHDGDMLAALLEAWGYSVVRGSSSRGGSQALDGVIDALGNGRMVAMTPDGPRGPAHSAKAGAFVAAARCHCSVTPLSVHFGAAITLRSWDAFRIPLPFSRVTVVVHPAMAVVSDERANVDAAVAAFNSLLS